MLLNPYIEGELRFGDAYSYGFELSMQKQKGNFNFYSAYTYSRIFATIEDVNAGTGDALQYRTSGMNLRVGRIFDTQATFTTQCAKENTGSAAYLIQMHNRFGVVPVSTAGDEAIPDFSDEFFHSLT